MEIIIFEKSSYWRMQRELMSMFQDALKDANKKSEDDWISTEEAKALLGVKSKSKMQELRDEDKIKFSKHGKKLIKYSRSSILKYLERNVPKF
jgi:hypothetical protein